MGDFSNFCVISEISDILDKINNSSDTINLNCNSIRNATLNILPSYIKNIYLEDNIISEIEWDDRKWENINLKNNNFNIDKFVELNCDKLFLDNNMIKNITFEKCNINKLSISNNILKSINFIDCEIKEINLSFNKISKITTLPKDLIKLNCHKNNIKKISRNIFEDSLIHLDLSDNKLSSIIKIPENVSYLDLSQNKFRNFDISNLPSNLDYFDITKNKILNNNELFRMILSKKLFYDTDDENPNFSDKFSTYSSDSESSINSDVCSSDLSISDKLIKINENTIKLDLFDNDDTDERNDTDEKNEDSMNDEDIYDLWINSNLKDSSHKLNLFETKITKKYPKLIPVKLQWNFNL